MRLRYAARNQILRLARPPQRADEPPAEVSRLAGGRPGAVPSTSLFAEVPTVCSETHMDGFGTWSRDVARSEVIVPVGV